MTSYEAESIGHAEHMARSGQSNAPEGMGRTHTLVVFADDRHGAIDRIVGLMRRRRARMQNMTLGRSEQPGIMRVSVVMDDSEVEIEHLVEQIRKIVDVHEIINLSARQAITRELALVKVNSTVTHLKEIVELGHHHGAHVVDMTLETVTLEVTGFEEQIEHLVQSMQAYGVREIARTGRLAMARDEM